MFMNARTPQSDPGTRRAPGLRIAVILLAALSIFLVQGAPPPAEAQATTLVSTLTQMGNINRVISTASIALAQGFTTGTAAGGYTLSSIELKVTEALDSTASGKVRVELWSKAGSGGPDSKLADLTNPTTISAGTVSFTAPASTTLSASTTYFVVAYTTDTTALKIQSSHNVTEDEGGAVGWSVVDYGTTGDANLPASVTTWSQVSGYGGQIMNMAVKGTEVTATTLISNLGETADTSVTTGTYSIAQAFNTGSNSGGYTLASVEAVLEATNITSTQRDTIHVQLWSAASGGAPDSKLHDLTVPDHPISTGTVSFTAPPNTTLSASTKYFAVFYTDGSFDMNLDITNSNDEDSGGAAGWTIANGYRDANVDEPLSTSTWSSQQSASLRIAVNGSAAQTATPPTVTLTANDGSAAATVTEGSAATVKVTLSAALASDVSIPVTVTDVTTASTDRGTLATIAVSMGSTEATATVTTATDTDVEADETFTVALDTANLPSEVTAGTDTSVTVTIDDDDTAAAPAVLEVTAGDTQLDLSWTAPAGVLTGYDVHYTSAASGTVADGATAGTDPATEWAPVDRSGLGTTSMQTIMSLTNTTAYRVRVRATSAAGAGAWVHGTGTPAAAAGASNANLSALTASSSTDGSTFTALTGASAMLPAFDGATAGYRLTVANDVTHVKLTPTAAGAGASVQVSNFVGSTGLMGVTSGDPSHAIALHVGENEIEIHVESSDESQTMQYTVTVRRVTPGTEWFATMAPGAFSGGVGCSGQSDCATELTDAEFDVGGTTFTVTQVADHDADNFQARFSPQPTAALAMLDFCDGATAHDIPVGGGVQTPSTDVGWTVGAPVSLSIGTSCEETFLISNQRQEIETDGRSTNNAVQAQLFTTGGHAAGYTLDSVQAVIKNAPPMSGGRDSMRAEIWSWDANTGPDAKVYDLTVPAHPLSAGTISFEAPPNATLDASTNYYFVLYTTGTLNLQIASTEATDEDEGGADGWSILDLFHTVHGAQGPGGSPTWTRRDTEEAALLLGVKGEPVEAVQPVALISNIEKAAGSSFSTASYVNAQGFTTGYTTGTHTLTSIETHINTAYDAATTAKVRAELWSAASGSGPGAKLAELTVPTTLTAGAVAFTAPPGTTLAASTKYYFVIYTTDATEVAHDVTMIEDEDAGGAVAWAIEDFSYDQNRNMPDAAESWTQNTNFTGLLKIRVNGVEGPAGGSTDATLSALALTDYNVDAVTLTPTFAPGTYAYTAAGLDAQAGQSVTVTPTVNQTDATVRVGIGSSLKRVASGTASQDIELAYGSNTITVEVAAQDRSTQTYTITVERALPVVQWPIAMGSAIEGDTWQYIGISPTTPNTMTVPLTYAAGATNPASLADDLGSGRSTALTMTINDNALSTAQVPTTGDTLNEEHETFTITMGSGTGYTLGSRTVLTVTIRDNDPPAAPGSLGVTAGNTQVTATWQKPDGPVTGYQVRHKLSTAADQTATTAGDPSTGWVTADVTTTTTDITGLTNGMAYNVQVRATDGQTATGNGYGDWTTSQTQTPTTATLSSNADLSALTGTTCTDSSTCSGSLTLSPSTFAPATTEYTAAVPNGVTHVKLTPTVDDTGKATVTVDGNTTADATTSTAIALSVGSNTITVQVTAENGSTKDYTVTVTRDEAYLVSNIRQAVGTGTVLRTNTIVAAQAFTTGSESGGYTLDSITAHVTVTPDNTQRATIRAQLWSAASGGAPNAKLADLTVPASLTTGLVTFADAANTTLTAGTTYFLVIYTVGAYNLPMQQTSSLDNDLGSGTGWAIADNYYWFNADDPGSTGNWAAGTNNRPMRIAVKGSTAGTTPSITLTSGDADNSVAESAGTVTITATLSAAAGMDGVPVTVAAQSGSTATVTTDYTLTGATFTITSGNTSGTATLTIVDDSAVEANETVVLQATATGHTAGSLTVTIEDNDRPGEPTGLMVADGAAKLDLSWTAPAGTLTGYHVHYTSAASGTVANTAAASGNDPSTAWVAADRGMLGTTATQTISSLTNGTTYRVRVRATSAAGNGGWIFHVGTPSADTVTLTSDDADNVVTEGDSDHTLTLTATLKRAAGTGGVTVMLARQAASTATATTDYTVAGSITVMENMTTATTTLTIKGDRVDEDNETIVLQATATDHDAGSLTVTITDDDTRGVTVSETARTVEVGETTTYTVKLDSDPAGTVVITPSSTMTSQATFTPATLSFTGGSSGNWGAAQTVTIRGVAVGTPDITHAITTQSTAGKYPTSLTINKVDVSVTPSTKTYEITATKTVAEDVTSGNVTLTVTLGRPAAGATGHELSVIYGLTPSTTDHDAASPDRGSSPPTTVTVAQNMTTATLTIPIANDALVEHDETFRVTVRSGTSGWNPKATGKNKATVTIEDDDADAAKIAFGTDAAGVTAVTGSWAEGDGTLSVPVTVSHLPQVNTTFNINVLTTGTHQATQNVDYTIPASVTFGPTDMKTKTVAISILNDALVEFDETISLQIAAADSPVNDLGDHYTRHASGSKATWAIDDDEAPLAQIRFGNSTTSTMVHTLEPDENVTGGTVNVPIIISHLPNDSTTFTVAVLSTSTATEYVDSMNPGDFRIADKTVTFGNTGSKTRNLMVTLTNDNLVEQDQTIELRIVAADTMPNDVGDHYARHADGSRATLTIDDDEANAAKVAFGSSATSTTKVTRTQGEEVASVSIPITITAAPEDSTEFTVTVTGTATKGTDYTIAAETFTFTKTSGLTQTLAITLTNDALVELDQTIELEIASGTGLFSLYERNAQAKLATVTIEDDERPDAEVAFGSDSGSMTQHTDTVAETVTGGMLLVPVTINHLPESSTTFNIEVLTRTTARETDDPANPTGNPKDYEITTKSVTFGPTTGKTQNLTIDIENDIVEEDDEKIELRIAAADAPVDDLGDYYTRDNNGSTSEITLTSEDAVSTVTLEISATDQIQGNQYNVFEGASVTLTATADIPVGPNGWQVVTQRLASDQHTNMLVQEHCRSLGNHAFSACPNDFTLPGPFAIEEGQTVGTGTLVITRDTRMEDVAEHLDIRGQARRGGRHLNTNSFRLRINESNAGINLDTPTLELIVGETATYTVALRGGEPSHGVTVTPSSSDSDTATVSGALTFTGGSGSNWETAQEVTVTAVKAGTVTISHTATSDDSTYSLASSALGSVRVTVKAAEMTYQIDSSATAAEGESAELTLTLGALAPSGGLEFTVDRTRTHRDIRISGQHEIGEHDPPTAEPDDDLDSPPTTVTVEEGKRRVTLSEPLLADNLVEGEEFYYLVISTSVSGWEATGTGVNCLTEDTSCARVTITDPDVDEAKIAFGNTADSTTAHEVSVSEGVSGGSLSVPVTVNKLPKESTTFDIEVLTTGANLATEGADYSITTKSVTFGPDDTDMVENLVVTITNDTDIEGDETIRLRIVAADTTVNDVGDHFQRDGNGSQATITLTSDDGGVEVSETAVSLRAEGEVTYTVRLVGTEPAGTVTIAVASSDATKATVSPATLDFTTQNWNQTQEVTIRGVTDGNATITHTVTAAQPPGYPSTLAIGSVSVTVASLPTVDISVSPNPVDEGGTVTVTITLSEAVGSVETIPIVLGADSDTAEDGDYGTLANIPTDASGTVFTGSIRTNHDDDTKNETFTVALGDLTAITSLTAGATTSVVVTITDDDEPRALVLTVRPGNGSLALSWTEPTGDVTGYAVAYKTDDAADQDANPVDDPTTGWVEHTHDSTGRTATIPGLTNGTAYDVRVTPLGTPDIADADTASGTPRVPPITTPPTNTGGTSGGSGGRSNDPPEFDDDTITLFVVENSPAGTNVGDPVVATDRDNDRLRYSLLGPDRRLFDIDEDTGQITVKEGTVLDYEGNQNEYEVRVIARDRSARAEAEVTIVVTNAPLPGKSNSYDANGNERLERDEVLMAVVAYFAGELTLEEILAVILLYFFPN